MSRPAEKVPAPARPGEAASEQPVRRAPIVSGIVGDTILGSADVARARERRRIARLRRLVAVAALVAGLGGHSPDQRARHLPDRPPAARAGHRHPDPPHRLHARRGHAGPAPRRPGARRTRSSVPARPRWGSRTWSASTPSRPRSCAPSTCSSPTRRSATPWADRHGAACSSRGHPGTGQDLRRQGHGQGGQRPVPVRLRLGLPVDVLRPDEPQDPLLLQAAAQARPQGGRRHRLHRGDRRHRRHPARHGRQRRDRGRVRRGQRAARAAAVLRHADPGAARRLGLDRPAQPLPARRQQAAQAGRRPGQRAGGRRHQPQGRPRPGARSGRAASTAPSTSGCPGGGPGPTSSPTTWARRRTPPTSTSTAPSTSWPA